MREPTVTTLVMQSLIGRDDFMSYEQLRESTGANQNQVAAATHHLRKRNAIDCVVEPNGVVWWYATPWSDNRSRKLEERRKEPPGNRKRRKLKK